MRSAQKGRQVSIQRLQMARKQGLHVPTLEEAMRGIRETEEKLKTQGVTGAKEAHKGQSGQRVTNKQRREEAKRKTKEEGVAEGKIKSARRQGARG